MPPVDPPTPEDPQRERELSERGRELVAAAVTQTRAPLALRERLEAQRERGRRSAPRRRWLGLAGSFAAVAAVAATAVVISLGGGSAPSVLATVQLASAGPTLPAPAHNPRNPSLLQAKVQGLSFPAWDTRFAWRAVGARRDEIEGRPTTTVYYDNPRGARTAYTIVGGAAIEPPAGARRLRLRGTDFHLLTRADQRIVVWDRAGHTCVMSAPMSVPQERLLALAAWDDGGNVPF
jgi:anti-sigma factor RsiW